MKNVISITAIAVLAGLVLPTTAEASITNGGFEDDFTGWEAIGDYRVENSKFGSGPIERTSQAFLSTAFNEIVGIDENGYEIIGGNAAPVTFISGFAEDYSLEGFLAHQHSLGMICWVVLLRLNQLKVLLLNRTLLHLLERLYLSPGTSSQMNQPVKLLLMISPIQTLMILLLH